LEKHGPYLRRNKVLKQLLQQGEKAQGRIKEILYILTEM